MPSKWYKQQPSNRNFLAPSGFKMELELFAGVDFFCQSANIPDITATVIEYPTRFRNIPIAAAGGIQYGDLRLKFIIDEDLKNYLTVYNWMRKNNLSEEMDDKKTPEYSKGELLILNSNFNPNIIIAYNNLFPVDLSGLTFDVEDTDVEYLTADVTFKFTDFTFRNRQYKEI